MKVTVILTSYNHAKYIGKSIESVLNQTFQEFDLIIYDDCSTDNSLEIIESYDDKRIKVIASKVNQGCGWFEYLIPDFVRGEYVAIAHSDDFWESEKLQKQVDYLDSHNEVSAVFTHVNIVDEYGNSYENSLYDVFNVKNKDDRFQWLRHFFYEGNCLCHPSVLIRRDAYIKYRLFPKGLRQIPDFYIWIRLCLNSNIYVIEERLSNFRVRENENNTSGYRKGTSVRSSIEINLILKQFLDLKKYDDFLKVFPEAEEYSNKDEFINRYSFARICLQENMPNYVKAYGFQLLFELLNEKENAEKLQTVYGFGANDFFALTGHYDIYGLYRSSSMETTNIYMDFGDGYLEENCLHQTYEFWKEKQEVELEFTDKILKGHDILKIRIDPIENAFVKCRILKFRINDVERKLIAVNSSLSEEDDIFLTSDPNYEYVCAESEDVNKIDIIFCIERLSDKFLDEQFQKEKLKITENLGEKINRKINDINELKLVIEQRDKDINELKGIIKHRDKDIKELKDAIEYRDNELQSFNHLVGDLYKKNN